MDVESRGRDGLRCSLRLHLPPHSVLFSQSLIRRDLTGALLNVLVYIVIMPSSSAYKLNSCNQCEGRRLSLSLILILFLFPPIRGPRCGARARLLLECVYDANQNCLTVAVVTPAAARARCGFMMNVTGDNKDPDGGKMGAKWWVYRGFSGCFKHAAH